jgi:transposase
LSAVRERSPQFKRAQSLLAADAGRSDEEIARTVAVGGSTVYRTKRRFVEGNLERALSEEQRPVCIDIHRPWRNVKVTERRAAEDYAQCMRELVDVHYPDAECIRVVQDNLSIHSAGALYQAFEPAEARRILRRLERARQTGSWRSRGGALATCRTVRI